MAHGVVSTGCAKCIRLVTQTSKHGEGKT